MTDLVRPERHVGRCAPRRVARFALAATIACVAATAPGAVASARAAEKVLTLDPAASTLSFILDTTFHKVHGTMKVVGGTIRFDPAGGAASGEITVDAKSARTGNGKRDKTMHADILESARFPTIVFTIDRVEGALPGGAPGELKLHGAMTLHGSTHPVILPARVRIEGARASAEASLTVPYVEWGLADPSFFVVRAEKTVDVSIVAQGTLADAP